MASNSLGIPTITSMPLPLSARRASGSASNSFTFPILFSFIRSTTTLGGSLWEDTVPQLTPTAESTQSSQLRRRNPQSRIFAQWTASISSKAPIFIATAWNQPALAWNRSEDRLRRTLVTSGSRRSGELQGKERSATDAMLQQSNRKRNVAIPVRRRRVYRT